MTDFEAALLKALPTYALDQLRRRLLFSSTTNHLASDSARALFQMAYDTEIRAIVSKIVALPDEVAAVVVAARRSFLAVDADLSLYGFLVEPALAELEAIPDMPPPYVDLIRRHLQARSPRYRVAAAASSLCLATAFAYPAAA